MKRRILKILLITAGILILLFIIAFAALLFYVRPYLPEKDSPHHIADFIKKNPDRTAIYLVRNGEVLAERNADALFPLASTVKTIVAVEYAKQVGSGKIDPLELIELNELDKYYLPETDGGAHPARIKDFTEKGLIQDGKTTLENVAKGMIWHSSNANTEFLLEKLGLENINRNLSELGLNKHQKIYYFTASMLLLRQFSAAELEKMSMDDYIFKSFENHENLKNGSTDKTPQFFLARLFGLLSGRQKVWSDRLPAASAREYASVMKKINDRNFFDQETQKALDPVMGVYLQNPKYRETFEHIGGKGGSTAYVLTKALYATDKTGHKTELCLFFNNLNLVEFNELQQRLREFENLILTDEQFRKEILEILNQ